MKREKYKLEISFVISAMFKTSHYAFIATIQWLIFQTSWFCRHICSKRATTQDNRCFDTNLLLYLLSVCLIPRHCSRKVSFISRNFSSSAIDDALNETIFLRIIFDIIFLYIFFPIYLFQKIKKIKIIFNYAKEFPFKIRFLFLSLSPSRKRICL